ncbi:MAG: acyl-CoA dehydratase activase [Limnochordia bacterium]|jgi:predicted CoA-substrate-specific enzyme activase|nr:acyl-CoA dehydratase activase [Bacillota bacterium]HOB07880.1 acyl-CoA dehydratase activase [Limnochordia bacterium]NLH31173.1 2-hydroxyglutaryl-CoA dehydratase [Bacillota bacterium]HPT93211.1 acyl-CoA dehydratase activase [Limnochordia bacterium]HPZ29967.1 acyl-CoA dehydratase activase [Limnochordia bacterium]
MSRPVYLGVDVGSVSTNVALLDAECLKVVEKVYFRTQGQPILSLQRALSQIAGRGQWQVLGVGATGSARRLAGVILGADVVKNEITAHALAALHVEKAVQTIIEIGGQDSKLIILRNGVVTDFAMNTVCAAGTGSFLDQQAARLGIPIEEFGEIALKGRHPVRIAGRCTVFAESDMIHKQQLGHNLADILAGLCDAMVRNYLNNVGKGKEIREKIIFQGGVAANKGMRKAFESALGTEVTVPEHYDVMGAIGAALLAAEHLQSSKRTSFHGFTITESVYQNQSRDCRDCPNNCELVDIVKDGEVIASWGSRCGKADWGLDQISREASAFSAMMS